MCHSRGLRGDGVSLRDGEMTMPRLLGMRVTVCPLQVTWTRHLSQERMNGASPVDSVGRVQHASSGERGAGAYS